MRTRQSNQAAATTKFDTGKSLTCDFPLLHIRVKRYFAVEFFEIAKQFGRFVELRLTRWERFTAGQKANDGKKVNNGQAIMTVLLIVMLYLMIWKPGWP